MVELAIEAEGEHCWLRRGAVTAKPFGLEYDPQRQPWRDELRVQGPFDLALVDPGNVLLHGVATNRVLMLTPVLYWLFEDVKPGAKLHAQLQGEDEQGCCFGFTGAAAVGWQYEHAGSDFYGSSPPSDERQRTAFNTWATHSGLRHHLETLVRRGFRLTADEQVTIELRGEPRPLEATVRISPLHPTADDSVTVLQFSRKPCATCRDGVSGWWLWKAELGP